jgi:hypothetical protein
MITQIATIPKKVKRGLQANQMVMAATTAKRRQVVHHQFGTRRRNGISLVSVAQDFAMALNLLCETVPLGL